MRVTIVVPRLPQVKGCGPKCLCGSAVPLCKAQAAAQRAWRRWEEAVIRLVRQEVVASLSTKDSDKP